MGLTCFIDNSSLMGEAVLKNDFSQIYDVIANQSCSFKFTENGKTVAYNIEKNNSLSEIYKVPFWVVKFSMGNVNSLHEDIQFEILKKLCVHLKKEILNIKGYYIIRMPSYFVDLLKAYNCFFDDCLFCGGTIEYIQYKPCANIDNSKNLHLFVASKEEISMYGHRLIEIAGEAFQNYQSQYHISEFTEKKADDIYRNWIRDSLLNSDIKILIAKIGDEIGGFYTFSEERYILEGILTGVSPKMRRQGIYKSMIVFLMETAEKKGKKFSTSTQFDNFTTQAVWSTLGLKPYYSIYNFHINNL